MCLTGVYHPRAAFRYRESLVAAIDSEINVQEMDCNVSGSAAFPSV